MGGVFTRLINRNTTIPTKKSQVFSTAADNQSQVQIKVLQGEREMAADNKPLGNFDLVGIPPAPRGVPQIEVTFDIDANGIVNVSAKDKATNKEQSISIQSSGGLSDADIENMIKEAELNAEEDKKRREMVDLRNDSEVLVYSTEKTLLEHGDKLSADDKAACEKAIADLKAELEKGDAASLDEMKTLKEELSQQSMKIGQAMYGQSQEGEGASASGEDNKEDVQDAEFKDKDKKEGESAKKDQQ